MTTTPPVSTPAWMEAVGRKRESVGIALLVVGGLLAALAAWLLVSHRAEYWPEAIGAVVAALIFLCAGLFFWKLSAGELSERDTVLFGFLTAGGLLGLVVCLTSIGRGYLWWKHFIGGLDEWQGENAWKPWVVIVAMLAGLVLMFLSLLLARGEEQNNPLLRQLLYGYVAGLVGFLLFMVLLVVNVMAHLYAPEPTDWTTNQLYTLSPKSREVLKRLDKPVKVYFLLASRRETPRFPSYFEDVSTLLENARGVTDKVQTDTLLRDSSIGRLRELAEKYQLIDAEGLLVVYGAEGEQTHQFLKQDDLYSPPPGRGKRPPFKGEEALMTALDTMIEGKSRAVVYFTQGNGELDIGVTGQFGLRPEQQAAALAGRLRKANYDVKGLALTKLKPERSPNPQMVYAEKVPDDATCVIVAGPQSPLSNEAVDALRLYMAAPRDKGKKGTMIVLAGADPGPTGKAPVLGLEPLLAEYNVELGNGRVLQAGRGFPTRVLVVTNTALASRNPVASVLDRFAFPMVDVRPATVRRGQAPRPGASNYQADDLLRAPPSQFLWIEEDLRQDPAEMVERMLSTEEGRKKLDAKLSQDAISVGVAVTESSSPSNPADPHAFMNRGEEKPRMIVIGNTSFASDVSIGERKGQAGELSYALVASSLAWLREKPTGIGIDPVTRKDYQMNAETSISRMIVGPATLMALVVVGLGVGVWIVRRR